MPSTSMPQVREIVWVTLDGARARDRKEAIASRQSWTAGLVRDQKCTFDAARSIRSISCSSDTVHQRRVDIDLTKKPGSPTGRCAKASGVQMLTTASMARTSSLTAARSMMWWCAAHEPCVDRPRSCGGAAPQGRNRSSDAERSNTRRLQSSPGATPSAWSRRVLVVVTVSVSRSPTLPIPRSALCGGVDRRHDCSDRSSLERAREAGHRANLCYFCDELIPGLDVLQFDRAGAAQSPRRLP